ncbi:hypothetical protein [Leifsonia sp. TF02-11]|uniref:hypothetical protein n=1 Tax=Leifsonia sp. TF02-11 TaxID=2815212 RepID=UPI001AA0BEF6|nr:hypothetical protein [Leifsonia sp. TF02-11]MBO1739266.1 hypothetical protein [Leifsonia sp. TF02-11]
MTNVDIRATNRGIRHESLAFARWVGRQFSVNAAMGGAYRNVCGHCATSSRRRVGWTFVTNVDIRATNIEIRDECADAAREFMRRAGA